MQRCTSGTCADECHIAFWDILNRTRGNTSLARHPFSWLYMTGRSTVPKTCDHCQCYQSTRTVNCCLREEAIVESTSTIKWGKNGTMKAKQKAKLLCILEFLRVGLHLQCQPVLFSYSFPVSFSRSQDPPVTNENAICTHHQLVPLDFHSRCLQYPLCRSLQMLRLPETF